METSLIDANVLTYSEILDFITEKIQTGNTTPEEILSTFEAYKNSIPALTAELSLREWTKKKLLTRASYGRTMSDSKPDLVKNVIDNLGSGFASGCVSWQMFSETYTDALLRAVKQWTPETLKDYAAKCKKRDEEWKAHHEKIANAIKDPKTLEDFAHFIDIKGRDSLTDEQLVRFDSLKAEETKAALVARREERQTAHTVNTNGAEFEEIQETTHSRKGHDLFVVAMSDRVERDIFQELKSRANRLGGFYSSYSREGAIPGFQFTTRQAAEEFRGNEEASTTENRAERQAERLREKAASLLVGAEASLNTERKQNTFKRAAEAASAYESARKNLAVGKTLERIAAAVEEGKARFLDCVKHKIDLFDLEAILTRAHHETNLLIPRHERDEDRPPELSDIAKAEFPWPYIHSDNLHSLTKQAASLSGLRMLSKRLSKLKPVKGKEWLVEFKTYKEIEDLEKLCRSFPENYPAVCTLEKIANFRRLIRLEIVGPCTLRAALRELLTLRVKAKAECPIAIAERNLVGSQIPGFFPTPAPLIQRMIDIAGIREGMLCGDMSAGKGDIAEAMRNEGAEVHTVEISYTLRSILEAKEFEIIGHDFLELEIPTECDTSPLYDAILINPPFENGQDMEHCRRAYDWLSTKQNSVLVAIICRGPLFRQDKKSQAFRAWLEEVGAEVEDLPSGTFKNAFRETGVETSLVTIVR